MTNLQQITGFVDENQIKSKQPINSNHKAEKISACFAQALHMHQPTIPAGKNGELISNLQYMLEYPNIGDNHNAEKFIWCYQRMGNFIPELVANNCNPRIMLDYSGNLLWGFSQMGLTDVIDNLKHITTNPKYFQNVEWLGTMWSHAVLPSTPIEDIKLHIQAWQNHFASIFGIEALERVKGFSPPEMHLPNHPDTLFAFVKTLKECGYSWILVQEHTIESLDGSPIQHDHKYIPNLLVSQNSFGEKVDIPVLVKTQGSDTKLVAQMQPYHEAKTKKRFLLNGKTIPVCVTQIADGENGGVMMNEFPRDFSPVWYEIKENGINENGVVGVNGSEYLEILYSIGIKEIDFPKCQAIHQHKIWNRLEEISPENVRKTINILQEEDTQFHVNGGSWTNEKSWIEGYENVLQPMYQLSKMFHEKFDPLVKTNPQVVKSQEYIDALTYNLVLQTSCFRYWGQGSWTDYAKTIFEKGKELVVD